MISISPLRYPGGKARFAQYIWEAIQASEERSEVFVEPFCGGAGVSLALLEKGQVQRIALNDLDFLVSSFWSIVFGKSCKTRHDINWLLNAVESADLSIAEWRRQKALEPRTVRESAWKCLYLNRTSFNGILHKSGPIGGWQQKNRTLDVRFNREKLIKKLNSLYDRREQVERVECVRWDHFCSHYRRSKIAYLYLDPPYYHRAEQLYKYLLDDSMHLWLRDYISKLSTPWMLSYDDAPEIRKLYSQMHGLDGRVIDQTYSTHPKGGSSFVGRELFFSNRTLPRKEGVSRLNLHVGMSIVGALETVETSSVGPSRVSIIGNSRKRKQLLETQAQSAD